MPNIVQKPAHLYCEYNHVEFPSTKEGPHRATLKTNAAQTCAAIWLESKKTKLQWECVIEDLAKLLTTDFALPSAVILCAIKDGLAAIDGPNAPEASDEISSSTVDLVLEKDALALGLCIHLSPVWTVKYRFEMAPIEVKLIDILEARIRDLEDATTRPHITFCTLTTTTPTGDAKDYLCEWTAPLPHEAAALVRIEDDDKGRIVVLQPGLYHIYCTFKSLTTVTGEVTLFVDDTDVGTAPYKCYVPNEDEASRYYHADVSHISQLTAGAYIELDAGSNDVAIPGSMTIRKLQQGAL
ncbi:hypothetical protein SDRG_14082 [Saprolegnia diclina VS20]|uniref:Uncharacterized protein n=1 Tax=Saprolegnia diclina (strain VS20) TaxID=1156394 RepID=T0RES2_SAPDV|nr:hypothetical protein SDRG_14082 [Saprolegnia diclina VS20]EQC28122.1 hypothetical protein SDRG_14082 [Saprolegnia diclina VS20]|eukprot:XP_008618408.1 hypothetical protein SDRG_14082 [Saprolegnia diclina VS20]